MDLQKLNVKFFVADPESVRLDDFIHIFNSWIQASDGAYYDLADYSHMYGGPGLVLVAHEANVSIDNTSNRWGLLYNGKRVLRGSNLDKLRWVFRAALENCWRIEQEPSLKGKIRFLGNEALFLVNDRLLAPNTEETFRAVRPELEDLARTLYANASFDLEHGTRDHGERFCVKIKTSDSFDVAMLLKNLQEHDIDSGKRAMT